MGLGIWSVSRIFLLLTLVASPLMILLFRPHKTDNGFWGTLQLMVTRYWPHLLLFGALYVWKGYVDSLNDPIRGVFGDFTFLIHRLEGDVVLWFQNAFAHPALTWVLNTNYLFGYVFLTYFSFILATYMDDRELANKVVLSTVVIYILAVPFYIFFNVQITGDFIPGMESLLYHSSGTYLQFFSHVDPLDNAWPSLHIAIPFGLFVLLYWTMRDRGETLSTWGYRRYFWLIGIQLLVFTFSILYLGIHWILDIPGGLLIGYLGALIVEEVHEDIVGGLERAGEAVRRVAAGIWERVRPVGDTEHG